MTFWLLCLGLAVEGSSTLLGLSQSIYEPVVEGSSVLGSLITRYGYLTVLVNEWVLWIWIAEITKWRGLSFLRDPRVHASAFGTVLVVMLYHHFVLSAGQWEKTGIDFYTNAIGHYGAPILYILWWLSRLPQPAVSLKAWPAMMIPAIVYPAYVLIRGALIDAYPYAALNVAERGYSGVISYMGLIVAVFAIFCLLAILANRIAGSLSSSNLSSAQ